MNKKRISRERNPDDYYSKEEFKQLIKATDNMRDYVLLNWLWYSHRRINEILHIERFDIDLDAKMYGVSILKRKRKIKKNKPLHKNLVKITRDWLEVTSPLDTYLFSGHTSKCISISNRKGRKKKHVKVCDGGHLGSRQAQRILGKLGVKAFGSNSLRGLTISPHRFRKSLGFNIARDSIKEFGGDINMIPIARAREIQIRLEDKNMQVILDNYFLPIIDREIERKIQDE